MMKNKTKVLIVGAGPTGLTAALALAQRGITPRIIDKHPSPITTSNALGIQPRTLEMWEEMHLIDDALALGHKLEGLTLATPEKVLGKLSIENLPTKYPFILALPQAKTEKLLTEHLSKYGVEIERNVCLSKLVEHEDHIEAVCNGETKSYSWVIGCDGVNSTVREQAGISFEGENLPQHFIMADIHIDWENPPNRANVIISEKGPIAFFPLDARGFGRLIIDVTGNERYMHENQATLEDFQKLLDERSGLKTTLSDPIWISNFWIQSRVAENYRKGRIFLAGDAAHRHSPFGGQGLNTGVQDAYFLAKLLAETIETNNPHQLELYERIRHPIGKAIVHRTSKMTEIMTSRSKIVQTLRNFAIPRLLKSKRIRHQILMTITQLIYR